MCVHEHAHSLPSYISQFKGTKYQGFKTSFKKKMLSNTLHVSIQ